jgi:hypothetical protein
MPRLRHDRYDAASGTFVWKRIFDAGGGAFDFARAIARPDLTHLRNRHELRSRDQRRLGDTRVRTRIGPASPLRPWKMRPWTIQFNRVGADVCRIVEVVRRVGRVSLSLHLRADFLRSASGRVVRVRAGGPQYCCHQSRASGRFSPRHQRRAITVTCSAAADVFKLRTSCIMLALPISVRSS